MSDFSNKAVRAITPILVGAVVSLALKAGVHVDMTMAAAVLTPLISAAYYAVVRVLEYYVPNLGWLLGTPSKNQADVKAAAESVVSEVAPAIEHAAVESLAKIATPTTTSTPADPSVKKSPAAKKATTKKAAPVKKAAPAKKAPAKKSAPPKK